MASQTIPSMMKALVKSEEKESYDYVEIPVPEPEDGEVLIRVDVVAICGSDIALYKWDHIARLIADIPFTPGHESAGTVVKCGPNVDIPIGAKVGVENHFYCENCYSCKHEDGAICLNMGQYGHGRKTKHGGCSEFSIVPAKFLYRIKENLDGEEIAMLEPLGVAHNAIERLNVSGKNILIIGCGPVGLMAAAAAKALGSSNVVATDIEEGKLTLAKKVGVDVTVNSKSTNLKEFVMNLTDNVGMDCICECSGAPPMVNSCFSLLRKGGYVSLVGLPKKPLHVENVIQDIVFKALTLKTVHGRLIYHTWEETERLVANGKIDVKPIISHRFPMSQFEEAFRVLFSGEACKIVMDPSK